MHIVYTVAVIVIVFFASTSLYVVFAQSKCVFVPDNHIAYTPADVGLTFETLSLSTEDDETIAGWYIPAIADESEPKQTVLFCHGNAGDIGDRVGLIRTFHRLGFNVLVFDYRGFGESSGSPSEAGTYQDVLACWDYLVDTRKLRPERIIVFGRSLGGAVACWMAAHSNPGALVLESVFSSIPAMAAETVPYLPVRLLCRIKYDNVKTIAQVKCPVLVAHSKADQMCPYKQGRRVFNAAKSPKQFVEMQGGHNTGGLDVNSHYQTELLAFVKKHIVQGSGEQSNTRARGAH